MKLEYDVKPYKKVDGIYSKEEKLTKWQKFCVGFGKFVARGLAGKWEFKVTIKF